jgi:hypothetical protein
MKLIVKTIRVIDQYSQTYFTMIGRFLGLPSPSLALEMRQWGQHD